MSLFNQFNSEHVHRSSDKNGGSPLFSESLSFLLFQWKFALIVLVADPSIKVIKHCMADEEEG